MKRYAGNYNIKDAEKIEFDVVIAGCGAAGLYAALSLDPHIRCAMLNKAGSDCSNSMYAQGGIAAVIYPGEYDDTNKHFEDTLTAGAGICDQAAVRVLVDEAKENIERLIKLGVPFDVKDGSYLLTREGGHRRNRILHCGGDATGLHMTSKLYEAAASRPNIHFYNNMFLLDIVTGKNGAAGIMALDAEDNPRYFSASKVIIASGGIGRVYRNSTNAVCATGDGIAAAARAGAELKDMEFVQFHPTSFIHPDESGRFFLISEALRGEGAILRNRRGEAFMTSEHPLADLAPRDIVSRAIVKEMRKNDIPNVYLDITARPRSFLKERFPTVYGECMLRGVDIAKHWIPVIPVQHYFMGGIKTDTDARTNIEGLFACGEAACTGVHGANRLASNSLLECLVFGRRCAEYINGSDIPSPAPEIDAAQFQTKTADADCDSFDSEIRTMMTKKCGIIRCRPELSEAASRVGEIIAELEPTALNTKKTAETFNRAQIASAVLAAALQRKVSVGAHYLADGETEPTK